MYIYVYIYTDIHMRMQVHHVYAYSYTYICLNINVYAYIYTYMNIHINIFFYIPISISLSLFLSFFLSPSLSRPPSLLRSFSLPPTFSLSFSVCQTEIEARHGSLSLTYLIQTTPKKKMKHGTGTYHTHTCHSTYTLNPPSHGTGPFHSMHLIEHRKNINRGTTRVPLAHIHLIQRQPF